MGAVRGATEDAVEAAAVAEPGQLSDEDLVAAMGVAAGVTARWQCRLLLLAAEVDRRKLWAGWGMSSAAAWLSWRCGLDVVTAREHLRVGRALEGLARVREAFEAGRLSYSKVRAVTRVASAADEQGWVDTAVDLPASELVRLTRGYRKATDDSRTGPRSSMRWHWDEEGMLRLSARLDAESGQLLLAALRQADDVLAEVPVGDASADASADAAQQSRAVEALTLVARASLTAGPRVSGMSEDYQLVLHVREDRLHLQGGPGVAEPLARRIACDATVAAVVHGTRGQVLGVGRRTRRIAGRLRRALSERDGGCCRYPGCGRSRWLQAHHAVHWVDGGRTDPDNLITLCSAHHRMLHEGEYAITADGGQQFSFLRSDGTQIATAGDGEQCSDRHRGTLHALPAPDPELIAGTWDGQRLNIAWAVAVIAGNAEQRRAHDQAEAA